MSNWTYINGVITCLPLGETQAEKKYVLETVLNHLPVLHGSERPMNIYINQRKGYSSSCSHDELGNARTDQMEWYHTGRVQDTYIITIDGAFRDTELQTTERKFKEWINLFSERLWVKDVLVKIFDYNKEIVINDDYTENFEGPSWSRDDNKMSWIENNTLFNFIEESIQEGE